MNRNQFIKLSSLSGIALAVFPNLAFQKNDNRFTYEELIGKGLPDLHGDGFKLQKEAYDAFMNMKNEAKESGIVLKVISSYRDFKHQNAIWERKYKSYSSTGTNAEGTIKRIIEYSTIPGTSRHHWGTDIDIVDVSVKQPKNLLNPVNFEENASFVKLKKWMDKNANNFGFYIVYTNDTNRKGFKYEPWHYSYKPLSIKYLSEYRQLNINEVFRQEKVLGSDYFSEEFIDSYLNEHILDINPELL